MFPNNLKFQTLNQSVGPKISIEVYSSYFDVQLGKKINALNCKLN